MIRERALAIVDAYVAARRAFAQKLDAACRLSQGASNVESATSQHYWASVLFTRMVVTGISIRTLAPKKKSSGHWDFGAVASLVRNLAECYLYFFFLCVDDVPESEKKARIIMLDLHDDGSRSRLFGEMDELEPDGGTAVKRKAVREALEARFRANAWLAALPPKRQRELLKGEKTPFVQDEVIDRTPLDRRRFRFLYRFLSAHVHSGPLAFYRMGDHGRGTGSQNDFDTMYLYWTLSFATELLQHASQAMLDMFPDAERRDRRTRLSALMSRLPRRR